MTESELIMEDMKFDTFEEYFADDKPQAMKPSVGPHRFKVLKSGYDEEPQKKWWFTLANKEGQQITKKCMLQMSDKKKANDQWIDCLFDSRPTGRPIDFDWSACEGRYVDAEVDKFTPEDRDTEVTYVYRPVRVDAPVEKAVAKRTTDQKAKVAMSAAAKDDIPF